MECFDWYNHSGKSMAFPCTVVLTLGAKCRSGPNQLGVPRQPPTKVLFEVWLPNVNTTVNALTGKYTDLQERLCLETTSTFSVVSFKWLRYWKGLMMWIRGILFYFSCPNLKLSLCTVRLPPKSCFVPYWLTTMEVLPSVECSRRMRHGWWVWKWKYIGYR